MFCRSLSSVVIPDGVTSMGEGAFSGCTGLREIVLSENLDSLRTDTFNGCASLKKLNIPEQLSDIEGGAFRSCTIDAAKDHRIAMAAAIAATICCEPVTILGADAVNKSYPRFWDEFSRLGGIL